MCSAYEERGSLFSYITCMFLKSQLQITAGLSNIGFVGGLVSDFVFATFFVNGFRVLCYGAESCCKFGVALNAIPRLLFLNRLVTFCIWGLW